MVSRINKAFGTCAWCHDLIHDAMMEAQRPDICNYQAVMATMLTMWEQQAQGIAELRWLAQMPESIRSEATLTRCLHDLRNWSYHWFDMGELVKGNLVLLDPNYDLASGERPKRWHLGEPSPEIGTYLTWRGCSNCKCMLDELDSSIQERLWHDSHERNGVCIKPNWDDILW